MAEGLTLTELKMMENRQLEQLPLMPELVEMARTFEWPAPTGKILSKDEALMIEVAEAVLTGMSDRRIAKQFQVNRRSIRPIMRILEERGKLAPLKERLLARVGEVAELSIQRAMELLEDDLLPAQCIPILMGVAIDKRELLAGGVTARVEERMVIDVTASLEALKALVASAPRRTIEAGSMGKGAIGGDLAGVIDVDTVRDADRTGGLGVQVGVQGQEGAGGGALLPAGPRGDGLMEGNLTSKGGS